jgi:hypothetical protein
MSRPSPRTVVLIVLAMLAATLPASLHAQRRGGRVPPNPPGHFAVRGHTVFVGGYFYDPHFGPYPWWGPGMYPYWYSPVYGVRASVRVIATPKDAAVYVDGFYAGIVDDFDGIFQSLPLPPGGHEITLYAPGHRTVTQRVYLSPDSTLKLRQTLERLPAGAVSEPPPMAPAVPPPPESSFVPFRTPPHGQPAPQPQGAGAAPRAVGYGSVTLRVQPPSADVTIDGDRWTSSEAGHFVIQLAVGSHRIDVVTPGYQRFSTEIQVRDGETTPLNVVLSKEKSQ